MLKTTHIIYDGRRLEVPIMPSGEPLHMLYDSWNEWEKTFCGPGKLGDKLVPDKLPGGTKLNPVCYVHDVGQALAETPEEYAQNDRMFMKNMVEAVFAHHPLDVVGRKEHTDLLWAVSYYAAVDSVK